MFSCPLEMYQVGPIQKDLKSRNFFSFPILKSTSHQQFYFRLSVSCRNIWNATEVVSRPRIFCTSSRFCSSCPTSSNRCLCWNTFFVVEEVKYAGAFVSGKLYQPVLKFAGKTWSLGSISKVLHFRRFCLHSQILHQARMKGLPVKSAQAYKAPFRQGRKKFYNIFFRSEST